MKIIQLLFYNLNCLLFRNFETIIIIIVVYVLVLAILDDKQKL